MSELLAALEASAPAVALRNSVWVYPLVNAGHIAGIALLVGAIVPLDLRLLGCWKTLPLAPLWRVLTTTANVGLGMAILFGLLLFSARATEYVASAFFLAKMGMLGIGILNAIVARRLAAQRDWASGACSMPFGSKLSAGLSIVAWTVTLLLGRLVGYF